MLSVFFRLAATGGICILAMAIWLLPAAQAVAATSGNELALSAMAEQDLLHKGRLFRAGPDDNFPASLDALPGWLARQQAVDGVDLLGGDYWLYLEIRNDTSPTEWVLDGSNTLIDRLEARIYAESGRVQSITSGYRNRHPFMLHYGQHVYLEPGVSKQVLIRFASPYFRSYPRFEFIEVESYRYRVLIENLIIIGCLGTLLSLSIFYTFAAFSTQDRSQLWYAAYMLCYAAGWGMVFHVPAEMIGFHDLRWHYVPFFLLPVLNTMFYREFLHLGRHYPKLEKASRFNLVVPLLLLPSCFLAMPYAHSLATVVITIWLVMALVSGIVSWRGGFRPARYFVLAFVALLIPGLIILPANVGLLPQLVRNAELFTLMGGTLDGLLLAFALADRVKLLSEQKDAYLAQMNEALALAHTDALTGIGNRYAFDRHLDDRFQFGNAGADHAQLLVLIDLDGLKTINDRHGHSTGDDLLRRFAEGLKRRCGEVGEVFRLGGDEFAIIARSQHEARLRTNLADIEKHLVSGGFAEAGISYGIAFAPESKDAAGLVTLADARMYEHKASRKQLRARS